MKTRLSFGQNHLPVVFIALLLVVVCTPVIKANAVTDKLLNAVVSLKIGMNGYLIGHKLDARQKEIADKHIVQGSYQDTYKFIDNGLYIVVDQKTDRILALYKQEKDANKNRLKKMVAELMDRFDVPTTMAHDKILYWAFNKHGAISEEAFNTAKKIKQTTKLGIIATVKLNSAIEISADPEENDKKQHAGKEPETGTIYFIITSDPVVQEFINSRQ